MQGLKRLKKNSKNNKGEKTSDSQKQDMALWEHVKKSISPLPSNITQKHLTALKEPPRKKQKAVQEEIYFTLPKQFDIRGGKEKPWQFTNQDDSGFTKIEKNIRKKLSKGHKPIEAVLDLHGMTQERAHNALKQFIHNCRKMGFRHVIVITGKGKTQANDPYFQKGQMGILRSKLPIWLSSADLKPSIVAYEQAPQHHGGSGAFYVHIRRQGR